MMNSYARAAVAAFALGLVAPAMAGDVEVATRTVSYADLDLTAPSGVAEFERRVSRAVRQLCRPNSLFSVEMKCRRQTAAVAAGQVERVVLAARSGNNQFAAR